MKITLTQPVEKRYEVVEVNPGDYIRIDEWDGISVRGVVSLVNKKIIAVESAVFLGGVHRGDYSEYENKQEFVFNLADVAGISVATFEQNSPLELVGRALRENYCGSDHIIMSRLFHSWYVSYVKDSKMFNSYCQYPIVVKDDFEGLCVIAVPNEESRKHKVIPKKTYALEFFRNGKWVGTHIISCFEDELETTLNQEFLKARAPFGAYRLSCDGKIIERGTRNKRFLVKC